MKAEKFCECVSKYKDGMLKDVVMDTQNIYAMVKITALPGMEFKQGHMRISRRYWWRAYRLSAALI